MLRISLLIFTFAFQMTAVAQSFDHSHQAFSKVLSEHVVVYNNGLKSAVDYSALAQNRQPLDQYLLSLSEVQQAQYQAWTQNQQLAFLINAYNGFTLQLIIDNIAEFESSKATSIRDLAGFLSTPWKQSFYNLLGKRRHLDWLEHKKIRVDFHEPRIHAALVCAAVSCPKLRAEAYVASQLTAQLENQMLLFLSDRDKNGIDETGLYLSKIFDWYSADFGNLIHFMQGYNQALTTGITTHEPLHNSIKVRYSHYNWLLNSTENM